MDPDKIESLLVELTKKIEIEEKVKKGAEGMRRVITDKAAIAQMELSIEESQRRLQFLVGERQKLELRKTQMTQADEGMIAGKEELARVQSSEEALRLAHTADLPAPLVPSPSGATPTPLHNSAPNLHQTSAAGTSTSSVPPPSTNIEPATPVPLQSPRSTSSLFGAFRLGRRGGEKSGSSTSLGAHASRTPSLLSIGRKPSLTNLGLSKSTTELSSEKVAIKLIALQNKIDIETRVKAGAEKLLETLDSKSELTIFEKKNREDVAKKLKLASEKVLLLKTALVRYQGMHVAGLADISELEKARELSRTPVSGKLRVTIGGIQNLFGNMTGKSEYTVEVRIDNGAEVSRKARAKSNESFELKLDKAHEIEFTVFSTTEDKRLLAVLFFRLCDVQTEIREQLESSEDSKKAAVENIWDMEPSGQIKLGLRLVEQAKTTRRPSRLQRHAGVRRRKLHVVNGHKFVTMRFYQFMKCALCQDYLLAGIGFRCEACGYLCHKKCHSVVVTKCISRADDVEEVHNTQAKLLKHNVPHRFEHATSLVPNWCSHCGYMLSMGKTGLEKCTECGTMCHSDCKVYIPNLCGMSMETANKILAAAQDVEKRRQMGLPPSATRYGVKTPPESRAGVSKLFGSRDNIANSASLAATATAGNVVVNRVGGTETSPGGRQPALDDFHFVAVLGKGNFGKVMLAEEKSTRQLYAIKVLKKEFILQNDEIESTRSEKRVFLTVNQFRHPFLVGLHSCFQTETRIYFVMEYVNGGDLMLHIQRQQFSDKRARFYACEVLLALEFFHQNDIVYRDLKLDNILLTPEGHVKIADYGLCKEEMAHGATTNTFCGTPEFMAPEILLEQDYGRAVDWWAFGVLIYEMLLGQAPFKGQDEEEIFEAIINQEVLYPVNMSKDAVSVIQRLLTKDPARRLGSGKGDAAEIKAHPFFRGVNWDDFLNKRIPPPFVPHIAHSKDVSNFDQEFTSELPVLTPVQTLLHEADQQEFRGFSYVSDWAAQSKE